MLNGLFNIYILETIFELFQRVDMLKGLEETIYMIFCSTIISYLIGLPLGIFVVISDKDGLLRLNVQNKIVKTILDIVHNILNFLINIGRSIPFIILIIILMPFTRAIVGKSWGSTATIVSLSVAAVFFVARIIEQSIREVDKNVIESAICMGANLKTIIFNVYLKEALPSIIRGVALTLINLVGYSAMAGAVGGGGLGDIAIQNGYYRFDTYTMIITLIIIVVFVQLVQVLFDLWAKKIDKSKKLSN